MRILPRFFSDAHDLFVQNNADASAQFFLRQMFVVRSIVTAVFFMFRSVNIVGVALLSLPASIIVMGVKASIKSVENFKLLQSSQQEKHLFMSIIFMFSTWVCFDCYRMFILSDPKKGIDGGQPGVLEYFFLNGMDDKELKKLRKNQLFKVLY